MTTNNDATQGGKIMVLVDSDLEDLIPGFLENRAHDIKSIEDALARKDYETIAQLGHTMKGVGGGYGFDAITDIGGSIEKAAKTENCVQIRQSIDALADYLARIDIVFEST